MNNKNSNTNLLIFIVLVNNLFPSDVTIAVNTLNVHEKERKPTCNHHVSNPAVRLFNY